MSHGLTIPEANKSPYPLQEPPHAPRAPIPVAKKQAKQPTESRDKGLLVGAALGIGAIAAVAAAVFGLRARRG
jgi:hypothetical protein